MRSTAEISIDLSTEELLQDALPAAEAAIESASSSSEPQNATQRQNENADAQRCGADDSIEIELTPEQIDALLSDPL